MKLIELIENRFANFQYYRDGSLWYDLWPSIAEGVFRHGFIFPVPISDIGNATFNKTEKAILLMRYIKKWKVVLEETMQEQEAVIKHDGGIFPNGIHPWRK